MKQLVVFSFFVFLLFLNKNIYAKDILATFENDLRVISWPENCLEQEITECSLKTHEQKKYSLKKDGLHIVMSENSILTLKEKEVYQNI